MRTERNDAADMRLLAAKTAVVTGVVVAIAGIGALIVVTSQVLLLVFAGLLLSVFLSALADALMRVSGLGRGLALTVTVVALVAATGATGWALWPSINEQADQLIHDFPAALNELRTWVEERAWGRWLLGSVEPAQMANGRDLINHATGFLVTTVSGFGVVLIVLVIGLFVAAQPGTYQRGLVRLVPVAGRKRADAVLIEIAGVLKWWLLGKVLEMIFVGVATTVGLWLLDVPLALTFGLLAAALTFIPNFGPLLSVLPPAILALAEDPMRALQVGALYLVIQTVESYALAPLIQRRTVSMPPALTISSQIVLGVLVGGIGLAVATPLTAAVMTAVRMLYVEDLLERGQAGETQEAA